MNRGRTIMEQIVDHMNDGNRFVGTDWMMNARYGLPTANTGLVEQTKDGDYGRIILNSRYTGRKYYAAIEPMEDCQDCQELDWCIYSEMYSCKDTILLYDEAMSELTSEQVYRTDTCEEVAVYIENIMAWYESRCGGWFPRKSIIASVNEKYGALPLLPMP